MADGPVAPRDEEGGVVAARGVASPPGERTERGLGSREGLGVGERHLVLAAVVHPSDQEPGSQTSDREDARDGPSHRLAAILRTGLST